MDRIARKQIATAFLTAVERENLSNREAAIMLGIEPKYFSFLKREEFYSNFGNKNWEILEHWIDQRCAIKQYEPAEAPKAIPAETVTKSEPVKEPVSPEKKSSSKIIEKPHFLEFQKINDQITGLDITMREFRHHLEQIENMMKTNARLHEVSAELPECRVLAIENQRMSVQLDIALNLTMNGQQIKIA